MRLLVATLILSLAPLTHAQTPAETLLRQITLTARQTRTLSGQLTLTRQSAGQPALHAQGTFTLAKPNQAILTLTGDDTDPPRALASDGHDLYTLITPTSYTRTSVDTRGATIAAPWWAMPLRFFYTQSLNPFGPTPDPTAKFTIEPTQTIAGKPLRVLLAQGAQPMVYEARFYIDANNLIERSVVTFGQAPTPNATFTAELSTLQTNRALKPATFHFTPPAKATLKEGTAADEMLALGDTVPAFTLPSKDGQLISLASQLKGHKATLINFWYLDCPPCLLELPDFERLYQTLAAKGLNVLAIDKEDTPADVNKLAQRYHITFPILMGGQLKPTSIFATYRVTEAFPGTYLVDDHGRILYRAAGQDLKGLEAALKSAGVE